MVVHFFMAVSIVIGIKKHLLCVGQTACKHTTVKNNTKYAEVILLPQFVRQKKPSAITANRCTD
jgi:hypothetical protein